MEAESSLMDRRVLASLRLLSPADVADMLDMDQQTVRRMALAGAFPRVELGHRTIRFRLPDVLGFIEAHTKNEEGAASVNATPSQNSPQDGRRHGAPYP